MREFHRISSRIQHPDAVQMLWYVIYHANRVAHQKWVSIKQRPKTQKTRFVVQAGLIYKTKTPLISRQLVSEEKRRPGFGS